MDNYIDQLVFAVNDFFTFAWLQASARDGWGWFLFFFPLFIFGEVPRYGLPAVILPLLKWLGLPPDDETAKTDFMATGPRISVLLVGYNEEESVGHAIDSLIELDHPGLEIIVVDDHSTDRMFEVAKPYADRGQIKLFRNTSATGRGGKPSALNMAFYLSTGDYILAIDSDTSFDRDLLLHMIGPFYEPQVGAVAGNVKIKNGHRSLCSRLQAMEYLVSIGMWKRWLDLFGTNYLGSGAITAFRRQALDQVGAWDPELGEDADVSMKIRKAGWRMAFAPLGVAMTNCPTDFIGLFKQRIRWDKAMIRTYYRKHRDMLDVRRYRWSQWLELYLEFFFAVVCTYLVVAYTFYMLWFDPRLLLYAYLMCLLADGILSVAGLIASWLLSERREHEVHYIFLAPLLPVHKAVLQWVRFYALTLEFLRFNYEETFLPQSAWRNSPRW